MREGRQGRMEEGMGLKWMCPVTPPQYPHGFNIFNILAKARMFQGYKVSVIFMVEVFCLIKLQSRNVWLVGLASQGKKMLLTWHHVLGACTSKKPLSQVFMKNKKRKKQKHPHPPRKTIQAQISSVAYFSFFICVEFDLVCISGFCLEWSTWK